MRGLNLSGAGGVNSIMSESSKLQLAEYAFNNSNAVGSVVDPSDARSEYGFNNASAVNSVINLSISEGRSEQS